MKHGLNVSRRRFLERLALAGGGLAVGGATSLAARKGSGLPKPGKSGIDHVVVLMMENRSFDHMLGWLPGADGRQGGLTYSDAAGNPHPTHPLAPDYQGCAHPDPDHSYQGGRVEYNDGACDGWLRAGSNDDYAIGYYTRDDLPFFASAATGWTSCDRYFAGTMAETFPNRFYQHAAQTDRLTNTTLELSTLPTIWDRLAEAGLEGRYYFSDAPFLGLWGTKYIPISHSFDQFLQDCADGTLPHVSFVDPAFIGEASGTSSDDHPHADVRNGQAFMNLVYGAVTQSPNWRRTLLVINYDEWGGFFDHVPPPTAPIPPASAAAGDGDGLLGFRVPCLLFSPYAPRQAVSHLVFDHTSVLRFIEWRWNLPPLTVRDATANNLAEVLDFHKANVRAPLYPVPTGPFGAACPNTTFAASSADSNNWSAVRAVSETYGWTVQR